MGAPPSEVKPGPSARAYLALAATLAVLATSLSAWVAVEKAPMPGDVGIMQRIQDVPHLERPAELVNAAATWRLVPFALATALLLARLQSPAARQVCLTAFVVALVMLPTDSILKELVRSPRPVAGQGVLVDHVRSSFGFPSGHVHGDVVVYGTMAVFASCWLPKRLVRPAHVALVLVVVAAGPSRVIVGAHWPVDAVGGYLWGAVGLCLTLASARAVESRDAVRAQEDSRPGRA